MKESSVLPIHPHAKIAKISGIAGLVCMGLGLVLALFLWLAMQGHVFPTLTMLAAFSPLLFLLALTLAAVALVLGLIALQQIKKSAGGLRGKRQAIIAVVCAALVLLTTCLMVLTVFSVYIWAFVVVFFGNRP